MLFRSLVIESANLIESSSVWLAAVVPNCALVTVAAVPVRVKAIHSSLIFNQPLFGTVPVIVFKVKLVTVSLIDPSSCAEPLSDSNALTITLPESGCANSSSIKVKLPLASVSAARSRCAICLVNVKVTVTASRVRLLPETCP